MGLWKQPNPIPQTRLRKQIFHAEGFSGNVASRTSPQTKIISPIVARKQAALGLDELKRMGVVLKRAQYFITCRGFAGAHPGRGSAGRERITRALIDPNVFSGGVEQLSMFSPPAVDRLVEQGVPPRTAQKMVREEAVQCLARAL